MGNVSRTFKSRIYHLLERPASHRAALRRNRSVLIDTSKIQTDGKAKSSPADFVISISCCQRRPVSTTVTIRSGDRIPITIRIAQSSQDCTGPALVSCLAVTFQAIQAAATLKPISDSGIPTLLVRKSSKSNTTGELVFTTLVKEGMPLLRYRTKDLTSIDHSTCECGRTLPRISKFKGRTDDMKVIRGVNVFPTQVETALLSIGGGVAPHYMMIVDRENNLDVLTVMVEVDEKYFSDEIRKLDELKNKVAAVLKQALGVAVRVKLVEPKTIERSEGKAKRVIDNRGL